MLIPEIVICAVGLKGSIFVEGLLAHSVPVKRIVSYDQMNDLSRGFDRIRTAAAKHAIDLEVNRRPQFAPAEFVMLVGWQQILDANSAKLIVFHDSLLPKYRGFAPTATALIKGEPEIGVTAIVGTSSFDEGPVLGSRRNTIAYPVTIRTALEAQASSMVDLALEILGNAAADELRPVPQDCTNGSFSLWRDDDDYLIDWSVSADEIARFIDAVGFPYPGARTRHGGDPIVIRRATVLPDCAFEIRNPGKVYRLDSSCPVVVCGAGLLRIEEAEALDGTPISFDRVRTRFR